MISHTHAPAQQLYVRKKKINSFRPLLETMTRYPRTIHIIVKFYWLFIEEMEGLSCDGFLHFFSSSSFHHFPQSIFIHYSNSHFCIFGFSHLDICIREYRHFSRLFVVRYLQFNQLISSCGRMKKKKCERKW